jgi:C-terminal processing protease CtpA/Prc
MINSPPAVAPEGQARLPVVREIVTGTAAACNNLRPGDRLLAIDGAPCAGRPVHTFARRLWLAPGSTVELDILTVDGARRTVRLPG